MFLSSPHPTSFNRSCRAQTLQDLCRGSLALSLFPSGCACPPGPAACVPLLALFSPFPPSEPDVSSEESASTVEEQENQAPLAPPGGTEQPKEPEEEEEKAELKPADEAKKE